MPNYNMPIHWDFRDPINHRYDNIESPYWVDRWRQIWAPEIIRQWRTWKQLRDEWAEFLRTWSLPGRRIAIIE